MKKEDFIHTRFTKKISHTLNICLTLSFILGLNIIASQFFFRKDLTSNKKFSLSPETLAYIDKIKKPVQIFVTIPPKSPQNQSNDIFLITSHLLNEYVYATRNNKEAKITIEYIDPFKQMQRAHEIATEFGVQKDYTIIFKSENNYRQILATDLFSKINDTQEFKGEQVFTSAILNVTSSEKEKIYFTTGHGEMRINDTDPLRGLSELHHLLKTYNIDINPIELSQINEIPNDANLIIIASPQTPFLPEEINQLKHYLSNRNGRIITFLDPTQNHGLNDLFYEWGILTDDLLILDTEKNFKTNTGDLILRSFTNHPITRFLEDYQLPILAGASRPVRPDLTSPIDPKRTTIPLIWTSENSWAERNYHPQTNMQFNPDKDLPGPIPFATLSERKINSQLGINVPGGRLIVFGNSNLIANNRINGLGNKILIQNTINWAIDLNDLLNIPPKSLNKFQLTLSQNDLIHISLGLLSIPTTIACLGLIILTLRKR